MIGPLQEVQAAVETGVLQSWWGHMGRGGAHDIAGPFAGCMDRDVPQEQ